MDRRSWPWKKKGSDKTVTATDANNASLASSDDTKTDPVLIYFSFFILPSNCDLTEQIMNQQESLFDITCISQSKHAIFIKLVIHKKILRSRRGKV